MEKPVHYDIEKYERDCRAAIAKQFAEADAAVAAGDADGDFIAAQKEFAEARIQYAVAICRARNNGLDADCVVQAAGSAMGMMHGSVMKAIADHPDLVEHFNQWIADASADVQAGGGTYEGTSMIDVWTSPIIGGNA